MVQFAPGDWWTVAQAAEHLGSTPRWVQSLIKRKKLSAQKVGQIWLLRRKDVLAWKPDKPGRPPKGKKK